MLEYGRNTLERIRSHPLVALAAGVAGVLAFPLAIEGVWALVSDDPLIPWLGDRIHDWFTDMMSALAVVGIVGFIWWTARLQVAILKRSYSVQRYDIDRVPEGFDTMPGYVLNAGSDLNTDLTLNIDTRHAATGTTTHIKHAFFSARQGPKIIVKKRNAPVLGPLKIRLRLESRETARLKDGYVLIQATVVDQNGNMIVATPSALQVRAPLVE